MRFISRTNTSLVAFIFMNYLSTILLIHIIHLKHERYFYIFATNEIPITIDVNNCIYHENDNPFDIE
ncbi:hypothetical protein BSYN_02380 [Bacteroides sedimenti]|uniref:Uncharacterized protein n=1 Tax=Bacteroides sedimenti TaxID=2136147 RepID=A0ABM8I777_9BACE